MNKLLLSAAVCAVSFCGFAATHKISDITEHNTPEKALWVHLGDTIELPDAEYTVNNGRFVSIAGNVLTAERPGIVGVWPTATTDKKTDTMAIIVLPEAKGSGKVFVCDKKDWGHQQWCSSGAWKQVGVETNDTYPHNPDDIAIIIMRGETNYEDDFSANVNSNISLGKLYVGCYWDIQSYKFQLQTENQDGAVITFESAVGDSSGIHLCSNSGYNMQSWGKEVRELDLRIRENITIRIKDSGYADYEFTPLEDPTDDDARNHLMAFLRFEPGSVLQLDDGATFGAVNASSFARGQESFAHIELNGTLTGQGDYLNRNSCVTRLNGDFSGFGGNIVESSGIHQDIDYRAGSLWAWKPTGLENAGFTLAGYIKRTDYQAYSTGDSSAYVLIGNRNENGDGTGPVGSRLPMKDWSLNGGWLQFDGERRLGKDPDVWREGSVLSNCVNVMSVDAGFTRIGVAGPSADKNPAIPTNLFYAAQLNHPGKGTVTFADESVFRDQSYRARTVIGNIAEHLVGKGEDPVESDYCSIVPWMASEHSYFGGGGSWISLGFAAFDSDGRLCRMKRSGWDPNNTAVPTEGLNAYCEGGFSLKNLGFDVISVNSLTVQYEWGGSFNCEIGDGKTLEITSGGLILSGGKADIGTQDKAGIGTLKFGKTAYIWANNFDNGSRSDGNISRIWSKIIAPYGLVNCMEGNLLLGGDQTGIDDEIVVNAGTLFLGALDGSAGCTIDVPVKIVGGGSRLVITNPNGGTLDQTQNLYFEDVGGFYSKIEIPEGSSETCAKCYVDNVAIKRGTYGATGSGAANIDDDHFSGLGTLTVSSDDLAASSGLLIFIR